MSFEGALIGNIAGVSYFLAFQWLGILLIQNITRKSEKPICYLLLGSVLGSFFMQWIPLLIGIFTGFNLIGHGIGLLVCLTGVMGNLYWTNRKLNPQVGRNHIFTGKFSINQAVKTWKENKVSWFILITFLYFVYVLLTHTIPMKDGIITTGQATYGDMSMHLGFITSIAAQGKFPPEYSILPGTRLSYPFLCDSISSSIYLFGASLKVAYIVPMLTAILQVMIGFYCFIKEWLCSGKKAACAWILFFWNGGLGFIYFLNKESLERNFTDFYFTPTSLGDKNIRWAQILVNMLLPQRATLFGWAVLFPLLYLLYKAVKERNKKYFILSGILAGGLPLIHTHSFMAFGLVCIMWFLYDMKKHIKEKGSQKNILKYCVFLGIGLFSGYQYLIHKKEEAEKSGIMIVLAGAVFLFIYLLYLLIRVIKEKKWSEILKTWGIFLIIVFVFAMPQLLFWTFQQATEGGFLKSHFNWSNEGDFYLWFYIKNIGAAFLLFLPAYFWGKRSDLETASPLLLIWFVAELVVFQPNVYDNNKLLFVAYVFLCGITANGFVDWMEKRRGMVLKTLLGGGVFIICTAAAFLTMGREYVSKYTLFDANQVALARFIEKNVPEDAVILTNDRHNNEVAALTGRKIVCGAGTYLYYHGLDYSQQWESLYYLYQDPINNQELMDKYNISYLLISPFERNNYEIQENLFSEHFKTVYQEGDVTLYQR